MKWIVAVALLGLLTASLRAQSVPAGNSASKEKEQLTRFASEVEELRVVSQIPGLSAAVVQNGRLIWSQGFGFADRENRIPATPDTAYPIASITKTFASMLLLQLVEQGKLRLDDPVVKYLDAELMTKYFGGSHDDTIKVRHVLTHTSEGVPGAAFRYSGFKYGALTAIIERASGKTYRALVVENILNRFKMTNTVPGHNVLEENNSPDASAAKRYAEVLSRMAKPYALYASEKIVPAEYPSKKLNASAGLISTVGDLAIYSSAIDSLMLLRPETLDAAWTAGAANDGKALPYGLGWFVEHHEGLKIVYHGGWWPNQFSSLLLKVPEKNLTLILLANNEALSAPNASLTGSDITASPFVVAFMRTFIHAAARGQVLPAPKWKLSVVDFRSQIAGVAQQQDSYVYANELRAHASTFKWLKARPRFRQEVAVEPQVFDAYVGRYELRANSVITIFKEGGKLKARVTGQGEFQLYPESVTKYFLKDEDVQVTFVRDAQGAVTHLIVHEPTGDAQAKRLN